MSTKDSFVDMLKELLAASVPGLVTKDDLADLEDRVDELHELINELEARMQPSDGGA